jgi:hypothetical protein
VTFSSFGALLDALAAAIMREEGMSADYTNPGNLRAAPWLKNPTLHAGFWRPLSRAEGIAGIYHVAALHVAELQDLQAFIYIWAPPSENNSAKYLANVMSWTGITDASKPLYLLIQAPSKT